MSKINEVELDLFNISIKIKIKMVGLYEERD